MQKIYEDDNLLAANKPAGENFYWALKERPELLIVHRLDKETSGVILFAKNEKAQEYLRDLFKSRLIQKSYKVLVGGKFKDNSGRIELSIGRSKKTPLQRVAIGEKRGKIRLGTDMPEDVERALQEVGTCDKNNKPCLRFLIRNFRRVI